MTEHFTCDDVNDPDRGELAYEIRTDSIGVIRLLVDEDPQHLDYAFTWAFTDEGAQHWCDRRLNGVPMSEGDWYKIRFYAREAGLIS
jgi:hypothetical protein